MTAAAAREKVIPEADEEILLAFSPSEMKLYRIEEGERQFGASNGAVSFQLAQVRCGPDCVPVSLVIYIDGSFIKHGIPVNSMYGKLYTLCIYCNILYKFKAYT